jgi:3-hydroxybutyryl-CoA dehydrogenase
MQDWQATVVGTGMMGPGIAAVLALAGIRTHLVSRTRERADQGLNQSLHLIDQLVENELAETDRAQAAKSLLGATADLDSTLKSTRLVIESIPEILTLKQEFFQHLDKVANQNAILASNTSGISISSIAARAKNPQRILTTHFWNPPHLMPLVEVVMGNHTSEAVALKMIDLLRTCGKTAVLVRKDRPGQLGNRLQHALVREAINVVEEGIASPEDVDLAVKTGFGLRLPAWGVFEHADAVGLDLVKAIQDYVLPDLNNQSQASPMLNRKVESGELGSKTGRGFYDWSVRDMNTAKARRDAFLIQFLRERKKQNANG